MLKIIRKLLNNFIEDIDAGNSNITEEEAINILNMIQDIQCPYISKYQACQFLNISRAKFDSLVRDGKLPKGKKQAGLKELTWKKSEIIRFLKDHSNEFND